MATSIFTIGESGPNPYGPIRSPLIGQPRREPVATIPPVKPSTPPPSQSTLADIARSTTPLSRDKYTLDPTSVGAVGALKKHWPWLVVGGLVVAALVVT